MREGRSPCLFKIPRRLRTLSRLWRRRSILCSEAASLSFEFGAASHIGLRRSENQDHYIVLRRTRTQQLLFTNMPTESLSLPSDDTYAMAVADGMGGSGRGGLASQIALRAGWELAGRTTSWVMKLEDPGFAMN